MKTPSNTKGAKGTTKSSISSIISPLAPRSKVAFLHVGGMPTLSRLIRDYNAVRRPRGPYRTPMPDDVGEGGAA